MNTQPQSKKKLSRVIRTKTGLRVINCSRERLEPIVLPPPIRITAEMVLEYRREAAARLQQQAIAKCPPGARVVPVMSWKQLGLPEFAVVDEEDFERVIPHLWRCSKSKGWLHVWTNIPSDGLHHCELGRFILGVRQRGHVVRHLGDGLDCRRSMLRVLRRKLPKQ